MGFLQALGLKKAPTRTPENEKLVSRQSPAGLLRGRWWHAGVPILSPETHFQASQAMSHPGVYRIVNKIAESVAVVDWKVRKKQAKGDPPRMIMDATEKQLQAVLDAPSDEVAPYAFKYWMAANYAVFGHIPVKVGRTWDGMTNALYPLRNVQAQVVGDEKGNIAAYRFISGDGPQFDLPSPHEIRRRERAGANTREAYACVIAKPGLDILSLDNSPTRAATLPIETYLLLLQRARETAGGAPNKRYIIATDGNLTTEQEDQVYAMMNDSRVGAARSGQIGLINGTKVEIVPLDDDWSDIHTKMPSDDMMRVLAGIWGMPAQLLGLGGADAAKYAANYIEGRSAFYEDTLIPGYLKPFEEGFTQAICPPGYEIYFDVDSLEPLRDARVRRMTAASKITFITDNEKRALFDMEPRPWGDEKPNQPAPKPNPETNDPAPKD
jgi:phage portal protein BeeE